MLRWNGSVGGQRVYTANRRKAKKLIPDEVTPTSKLRQQSNHATGPATGIVFADLALALGVAALGVCLAVGSTGISLGTGYDRIGPRFFPYVVAIGLVLLGSWLAVASIRGMRAKAVAEETSDASSQMNWQALGYLGLALLVNLILLERAGFVISSSMLFWLVARAFHSRHPARDAAVAALLSVLVYFAFTRGLGLILPLGIFNRLF